MGQDEFKQLQQKRRNWVDANRENGFDEGINRLLTELYPDNAHFIYELLQNAEDPEATEVQFTLTDSGVEFAHNGKRLFSFRDVESITSIGNSTKRDDATSIGKFGVGFKAVFAYTNTPEIHSGDYHFRIRDLVVPDTECFDSIGIKPKETCFIFPFDNPKKTSTVAVQEVANGLRNLGNNTLLFLSHIRKIGYTLPDGDEGSLECIEHDKGRLEIRSTKPNTEPEISHWLRFQKEVEVTDDDGKTKTCRIAIAYSLVEETSKKAEVKQWKIVPLTHGQVSIYFPAEKETSNLKFHLHAPFASTVARDSVRDCPANKQLRDHLAKLVVESLTAIRDQGMLTVGFLAVLPIPRDSLAKFYEPIRLAIVEAFKYDSLTPTRSGNHAKAEALYRGSAKIAAVIEDTDLSLLTGDDSALWAANPPQMNQREDNFLDSLAIDKWDFEQLSAIFTQPNQEKILSWFDGKNDEWLVNFYELLNDAKDAHDKSQERKYSKQNWLGLTFPLVRVCSEQVIKHVVSSEAYFALEGDITPPAGKFIVKPDVCTKPVAKKFLENLGVRLFDKREAINLRLQRYKTPPQKIEETHYEDLKQFIDYLKNNPNEKEIFQDVTFLLAEIYDEKPCWKNTSELCVDCPLLPTGLGELKEIHRKEVIFSGYFEKLNSEAFLEFIKTIGLMFQLVIERLPYEEVKNNPYVKNQVNQNQWRQGWGVDKNQSIDYGIQNIEKYLKANKISASRLIWETVIRTKEGSKAHLKPNKKSKPIDVPSQLIYHLKEHAWVPNKQGKFCNPQDMSKYDLRDDFPYDDRNGLLTAIGFGENIGKRSEENYATPQCQDQKAQEMGFVSAEQAAKWAKLDKLGISPDDLLAQQKRAEQPEESVPNPERRRKGVLERSENAPTKESVMRERAIQPGIASVVAEAKAYLRTKYTNTNRELVCQCCQQEMPFKIGDAYYFEAVQCIKVIQNHHIQNHLALCPTCAAMYQHARATDDNEIRSLISEHNAPDDANSVAIPLTLADQQRSLRFVGTHFFDLKTVLVAIG